MNKYARFTACCHASWTLCLIATLAMFRPADAAAIEIGRPADAIEVFHCSFSAEWDANFDEWPDRWTRKSGAGYPHYVAIQLRNSDDPQATSGRFLQLDLDGASAAVASPPIRVSSKFSYRLDTRLRIRNIQRSTIRLTIDYCDSQGQVLYSRSQRLKSVADGWHTLSISAIDPGNPAIDRAIVTLLVERGARGDLHGEVCLDDVWLARLPRIDVSTASRHNVYESKDDIVVRCELSGIREQNPEIRYQLLDLASQELHGGRMLLNGRLIEEDIKRASDIVDGVSTTPKGYEGATEWRPKIPEFGFYSVVVTMLSKDASGRQTDEERTMDRRVIWLAVVPPLPQVVKGDFGWTLPAPNNPLSFDELTGLLPKVGVNIVKCPAWYDPAAPQRADELIRFVEILSASHIDVVGVIDHPPRAVATLLKLGTQSMIADLLAIDSASWLPLLDPVMSRLALRLRSWQLGDDLDVSLAVSPKVPEKVSDIRRRLFRFGQQVKLGVPWTCEADNSTPSDATWDFEQLAPDPALSLAQFEAFVTRPHAGHVQRWLSMEPPHWLDDTVPNRRELLNLRATEFVRKLIAAKEHGIDAIFISRPFNDQTGLMRPNGMPADLLLPWRTTAAMLSGAKYIGSVQLPNGSENRNFVRPDGQVVMVVWNTTPTTESLFLGNQAVQHEIWGATTRLAIDDDVQTLQVGPVPSFVLGVSEPIARWRMAIKFQHDHVESIFGKPHTNSVTFQNFFSQGVGGRVSIVAPHQLHDQTTRDGKSADGLLRGVARWTIEPPQSRFTMGVGETTTLPFNVLLKNATFGPQPIRVDFEVEADERYQFSVYRTMWVGSGDISVSFRSHLDSDGTLTVEQFMKNTAAKPVDFKCFLYAKGYRRQRAQVYRLGGESNRTVYRYRNGASLVGKELTLDAEEIGGERVLKCRFVVEDSPVTSDSLPPDDNLPQSPPASGPSQLGPTAIRKSSSVGGLITSGT